MRGHERQALRLPVPTAHLRQLRGDAEAPASWAFNAAASPSRPTPGPVHEVPVGHVGDQASASSSRSNQASALTIDGRYPLDRLAVAGQVEWSPAARIHCSVQSGISRPFAVVARREHLGQAVRPLALRRLRQELGGQRRDAGAEGGPADQVLHRHVAQPLALLAAGAILPGVVHALAQRVGAGRPELVEQWVGRGEAAAPFDRIMLTVAPDPRTLRPAGASRTVTCIQRIAHHSKVRTLAPAAR